MAVQSAAADTVQLQSRYNTTNGNASANAGKRRSPRDVAPPARTVRHHISSEMRPARQEPHVISSIIDSFGTKPPRTRKERFYDARDAATPGRDPDSDTDYNETPQDTSDAYLMDYSAYSPPVRDLYKAEGAASPTIPTLKEHYGESPQASRSAPALKRLMRTSSNRSSASGTSAEKEAVSTNIGHNLNVQATIRSFPSKNSLFDEQADEGSIQSDKGLDGIGNPPRKPLVPAGNSDEGYASSNRGDSSTSNDVNGAAPPSPPKAEEPSPPLVQRPKSIDSRSIADAIPTRSSSLAKADSPEPKVRRKSKRHNLAVTLSKSMAKSREKLISPRDKPPKSPKSPKSPYFKKDVLDELGDQDETVKRIRELRSQREERLRRSSDLPPAPEFRPEGLFKPPSGITRLAPGTPASLGILKPPDYTKAHKVLGLESPPNSPPLSPPAQAQAMEGGDHWLSRSPSSDKKHRRRSSRFSLQHFRPKTVEDEMPGRHSADVPRRDHSRRDHSAPPRSVAFNGVDSSPASPRFRKSLDIKRRSVSFSQPRVSSDLGRRRPQPADGNRDRILEEYHSSGSGRSAIDIAVDNFLQNPRLSQTVHDAQTGRLITYSEVGDPDGAVVFVCVGMGLTRYVTAFYDELATTLRLRLITPDRPGVGGSEAYADRERTSPLNWPDDVLTICQHLGISHFSLLAHSAGAIYALATALILPQQVHGKIHLLAPWIPPSQLQTYAGGYVDAAPIGSLPRSQRLLKALPVPFLKAANSNFLGINTGSMSAERKASGGGGGGGGGDYGESRRKKRNSFGAASAPQRTHSQTSRFEFSHRQSMLLMDQELPLQDPDLAFPLPDLGAQGGAQSGRDSPGVVLSATAGPLDEDSYFANEQLSAANHAVATRQDAYSSVLTEKIWALATRNANPAVDLLVCLERNRDIGFRYVDIQRSVVISHGDSDRRVPVENVKWIGGQMDRRMAALRALDSSFVQKQQVRRPHKESPRGYGYGYFGADDDSDHVAAAETEIHEDTSSDASELRQQDKRDLGGCEVRILPGEGHGLMASPKVMGDVLAEISREWMDKDRRPPKPHVERHKSHRSQAETMAQMEAERRISYDKAAIERPRRSERKKTGGRAYYY